SITLAYSGRPEARAGGAKRGSGPGTRGDAVLQLGCRRPSRATLRMTERITTKTMMKTTTMKNASIPPPPPPPEGCEADDGYEGDEGHDGDEGRDGDDGLDGREGLPKPCPPPGRAAAAAGSDTAAPESANPSAATEAQRLGLTRAPRPAA